ncbi:FxsA family protein [Nocardioides mesophilus]|uniref:FxsA family protein n=1 Tax=Nocardioides mesophilus TaxID=433659 RepID=A0A7G9RAU8_9ACTN|nr:FxsA family protein [Nocardioides mesophilus]QNN52723.1 FxsA family protein [Nocardioides mesophilus]
MRRRVPWGVLAVLFVVVPIVEIYLLIQVGQVIGAWWTVALLIADGFLGSWLVKHEGGRAWTALQEALREHRMPARELADGTLILIGGTLLLTPGFLSDVVGLFAILPLTRPLARRALTRVITRRLVVSTWAGPMGPGGPGGSGRSTAGTDPRTRQRPGPDESVVQGEVVNE